MSVMLSAFISYRLFHGYQMSAILFIFKVEIETEAIRRDFPLSFWPKLCPKANPKYRRGSQREYFTFSSL